MPFSVKPSAAFCLALVLVAGRRVLAVNDWSVPCTQGKCAWDLPGDSGASGSVKIVSLCSTYIKHVAFLYPSLTPHTYAYIVGTCQRNFGHYSRRWLANYHELRPEYHNARYPTCVQRQQSGLRTSLSGKRRKEYHCPFAGQRMFFFFFIFHSLRCPFNLDLLSELSVWPHAICARGSASDSSV